MHLDLFQYFIISDLCGVIAVSSTKCNTYYKALNYLIMLSPYCTAMVLQRKTTKIVKQTNPVIEFFDQLHATSRRYLLIIIFVW